MTTRSSAILGLCIGLLATAAHGQQRPRTSAVDRDELRLVGEALDKKEADILRAIEHNESRRIQHNLNKPTETDAEAVRAYIESAQAGREERQRLDKELADVRRQMARVATTRGRMSDQSRRAWLQARVTELDGSISELDARIKRTQGLLGRLQNEAQRGTVDLEVAAQEFQAADLAVAKEVIDLVVDQLATNVDLLPNSLARIDLQKFSGSEYRDLRQALLDARANCAVLNTAESQAMLKRMTEAKAILQKSPNVLEAHEVDKAASLLSQAMQSAVLQIELRTKAGRSLLQRFPELAAVERSAVLRAATALDLGERALDLWAVRGSQIQIHREVNRVTDAAERRDRLLREFSPGGCYFRAYQADIEQLKSARAEKARREAEAKDIETRLKASVR